MTYVAYLSDIKTSQNIRIIKWADSYGALSGWLDIDSMNKPKLLVCISMGIKVYENKKVVALACNYAEPTTYTPKQGNGIMVIPKSCIIEITSICLDAVSKLKLQHSSRP